MRDDSIGILAYWATGAAGGKDRISHIQRKYMWHSDLRTELNEELKRVLYKAEVVRGMDCNRWVMRALHREIENGNEHGT